MISSFKKVYNNENNENNDNNDKINNKILELLLKNNFSYLFKHNIDSYNLLVEKQLFKILSIESVVYFEKQTNNIEEGQKITWKPVEFKWVDDTYNGQIVNVTLAIEKQLSYCKKLYARYEQTIFNEGLVTTTVSDKFIEILELPIMVGSVLCNSKNNDINYDPYMKHSGIGYFILNGSEKGIALRPKKRYNEALITTIGKENLSSFEFKDIKCELFSKKAYEYPFFSRNMEIRFENNILVYVIKYFDKEIKYNIFSVIKAISDYTDLKIINYLQNNISDSYKEAIISSISITLEKSFDEKISIEVAKNIKDYIIHITDEDMKVEFILYCLKKLIRVKFGLEEIDDRDSYTKIKMIDTPGSLIEELIIGVILKTKNKNINDEIKKKNKSSFNNINISDIISKNTKSLKKYFISPVNWGLSKKEKVCEQLSSKNIIHLYQMLNKISDDQNVSVIEKRRAHAEQQGFIDTITSPTSKNVGLHKYLCLLTYVTPYDYSLHFTAMDNVKRLIKDYKQNGDYTIFLDGDLLKSNVDIIDIKKLNNDLDELRLDTNNNYSLDICHFINYQSYTFHINSHGGRLISPVIRLKNNKYPITYDQIKDLNSFDELLKLKVFDMVDIYSIKFKSVGFSLKEINEYKKIIKINYNDEKIFYNYNYCFFYPNLFSISAALLCFQDKQSSVRILHSAKQDASSIRVNPELYNFSNEKTRKDLINPSETLVKASIIKHLDLDDEGSRLLLTEMKSDSNNQEDSYLLNLNAIALGLLEIKITKTFKLICDKENGDEFSKPDIIEDNLNNKKDNYSKISENGIIKIGSIVNKDDILIVKIQRNINGQSKIVGELYDDKEPGRVISINTIDKQKEKTVIVKIVQYKLGDSGDKLASIYAQKGVIGNILASNEFGCNEYGFRASIAITPSSITRLTCGQFMEPLLNYYCLINSQKIYQEPFSDININEYRNYIEEHGIEKNGLMKVYFDKFQELCINRVNYLIIPFRRLKQTTEKASVKKASSPRDVYSNNPKDGFGLKVGFMETSGFLGHGLVSYLKEITNFNYIKICNSCGIKITNKNKICSICKTNINIIDVKIPTSFESIIDLVRSVGGDIRTFVNEENVLR